MFEVRFNRKIAQLREVLKCHNASRHECRHEALVSQLQSLNICDDQLFISLLVSTRPSLWVDTCPLFRALSTDAFNLSPLDFVNLVGSLKLEHLYLQIPLLPLAACEHLISMVSELGNPSLRSGSILENIVRSVLDTGQSSNSHLVQIVNMLLRIQRLPLALLLDCLGWLLSDTKTETSSRVDNSLEIIEGFVSSLLKGDEVIYNMVHKDCVSAEVEVVDRQTVSDYIISVISKQYSSGLDALVTDSLSELIVKMSKARDGDISMFCHCYHLLRRRYMGYKQMVARQCSDTAGESPKSLQLMRDELDNAKGHILQDEAFMLSVTRHAVSTNDLSRLALISTNIQQYLNTSSVREFLVAQSAGIRWGEAQTEALLAALKEERRSESRDVSADSQCLPAKDLEKIVLYALTKLESSSQMLQYDYLTDFCKCFSDTQFRTLINLSLNKIRPQCSDQQETINMLTVLLALDPRDVIKSFTAQILRSKSALAAIMSKVYMSMMCVAGLPVEVYKSQLDDLQLSAQQLDDLISKCLLFLPQFDCPVGSYLYGLCADRLNIDNSNLTEMLRNIEAVLTSVDELEWFSVSQLSTVGLFILSAVDADLLIPDATMEQSSRLRLSLRLLGAPRIAAAVCDMQRSVLEAVLCSLHPSTYKHLTDEGVVAALVPPLH